MDSKGKHGSSQHHNPSSSELLSSAKLLSEAAKSSFSHNQKDKEVDKAKLAAAAENILEAASHYGKFEDNTYVDKAEEYLHKYHSSHSSTSTTTTTPTPPAAATQHQSSSHSGQSGSGGYGDYLKMAEGFFKK